MGVLIDEIAAQIRELRRSRGLSQEGLAAQLGVATNTISRWETGTYRPSIEDLERLARFFEVSIQEFFPQKKSNENEHLVQLLRAAKGLRPEDLEELRRYAEFRRARQQFSGTKPPKRKRQEKEK